MTPNRSEPTFGLRLVGLLSRYGAEPMSSSTLCRAVGIDLGTFSVIAYLDLAGRPTTIPNAEGDLTTPSVVLFDGESIVVGKEAKLP